jgi:hypothetical protein
MMNRPAAEGFRAGWPPSLGGAMRRVGLLACLTYTAGVARDENIQAVQSKLIAIGSKSEFIFTLK